MGYVILPNRRAVEVENRVEGDWVAQRSKQLQNDQLLVSLST